MKKVAITGGLSSGKTSVCKLLKEHGAFVISADEVVHQLLSPQSKIGKQVIELLGPEIVSNNTFDRDKIAKQVFGNKKTLKALEHLLHPAVLEEIESQYNKVKDENRCTLFVAEVPLLYEIEAAHIFDKVIAVISRPEISKKRFSEKNKHSAEEFEQRMNHQLPLKQKSAKADYTLHNNGSLSELKQQVTTLYQNLTK